MVHLTLTDVALGTTAAVTAASLLYRFLPPPNWLDGFPSAQKYYTGFRKYLKYVAFDSASSRSDNPDVPTQPPAIQENADAGQRF